MGRVKTDLLEVSEDIGDRVLVLAQALDRKRVYSRIVSQLVGCGTSVGANLFEADEAMSTKDWLKSVGVALKELNETRYWLRRIGKQNWVKPQQLADLQDTCDNLRRVLGTMARKTKARNSSM